MASKPDFDPGDPYTIYDEEYLSELVQAEPELYGIYKTDENGVAYTDSYGNKILDEDADYSGYYRDIQWKNKTITELYYPGSVFKVITAAMGVDSGNATYYTPFTCSGSYIVQDRTYHCAGRKAHGDQTLADGLRNSCNIYFIQLGQRIGASLFYNYFKAFGFTETTGVDLPYETSFMQYYTDQTMGEVQLASSAFGQAMAITPLQTCAAIAACVNGGYLVTPHVVERITDTNGNVVQEVGTTVRRQVISESASQTIREIMEYEVGGGTITSGGYKAYVAGYRIGGKSGTSEQLNMDKRSDGDYKKVASFVAVLPADDPEILVYVMLDDPNNAETDYSSILAAPVVGNIISEIAPYLGIATDGVDRSDTTVKVPKLVGTEWSNAQVSLNIKGLEHYLVESESDNTGAAVTYQYPTAGTTVPSGTTVYLYTEGTSGSVTTVPDVQGKSAEFARQMLSAAGLNCIIEGDSSSVVQSQDVEAGASVQKGTIVTVTCAAQ
jgi:stage V sporulation protein D (sporulation-specific penicillin-binding protein)